MQQLTPDDVLVEIFILPKPFHEDGRGNRLVLPTCREYDDLSSSVPICDFTATTERLGSFELLASIAYCHAVRKSLKFESFSCRG
jgi:hypothetical protein